MYDKILITDIINNNNIKLLKKWFNKHDDILTISGELGVGKSRLIEFIRTSFNADIYIYYIEELNNTIKEEISKVLTHTNILELFNNTKKTKIIVFDNIYKSNKYIVELVNTYDNFRFIITTNNPKIIKTKYNINIVKKSKSYLTDYFKNLIKPKYLNYIINNSNGDIHYIKKTIEYIRVSKTSINPKYLQKDIDYANYTLMLKFLNNYKSFNDNYYQYDYINFIFFIYSNIFIILNKLKITDPYIISTLYKYLCHSIIYLPNNNFTFLYYLNSILLTHKTKILNLSTNNSLLINSIYVKGTYNKFIIKKSKDLYIIPKYFYEYLLWVKNNNIAFKHNELFKYLII